MHAKIYEFIPGSGKENILEMFPCSMLLLRQYCPLIPGKDNDKPEFSDAEWFSMLFACGIGIGLFFFRYIIQVDLECSWSNSSLALHKCSH